MPTTLEFSIDQSSMQKALEGARTGIPEAIDAMAAELRQLVAEKSSPLSHRLGDSWSLDLGGPLDAKVSSDVFFAGWLSRGTKGHGPKRASMLVFEINGEGVHTRFVAGVPAHPFAEDASALALAKLPDLVDRTIKAAEA